MKSQAKEGKWPLKAGEGKEINFSLEAQRNAAVTLILAQWKPFQNSDLNN